jgi:hypothetical protein
MQRSVQSVEAGQSAIEYEICGKNTEDNNGDTVSGLSEHDGDRSCEKRTLRFCNVKQATVLEVECLRGKEGELVIKELAICNERSLQQYIFRPPYVLIGHNARSCKPMNEWTKRNLNGFGWYDGHVDYARLHGIMNNIGRGCCGGGGNNIAPTLYTKGEEKASLLSSLIGYPVQDLTKFGAPKQKAINLPCVQKCWFHGTNYSNRQHQCALEKAVKFYYWLTIVNNNNNNDEENGQSRIERGIEEMEV